MKKRIIFLIGIIIGWLLVGSCNKGVTNPGNKGPVYIQVDSVIFKVVDITITVGGRIITMIVPVNSLVTVLDQLPQSITYKEGKTTKTIIKITK